MFDAPMEELKAIDGIGDAAATLMKLIPELARCYMIDKVTDNILNKTEAAGQFLIPHYIGKSNEQVYMLCLDAKCKVLGCRMIFEGSVNSTHVNLRKIVETALKYNSSGIIISHNHPGGIALPSDNDISTTKKIKSALETVNISLIDHIIVADNDFVSLADSGILSAL